MFKSKLEFRRCRHFALVEKFKNKTKLQIQNLNSCQHVLDFCKKPARDLYTITLEQLTWTRKKTLIKLFANSQLETDFFLENLKISGSWPIINEAVIL